MRRLLQKNLPDFNLNTKASISLVSAGKPKISIDPYVIQYSYYNVSIGVKLWNNAEVYGIIIPRSNGTTKTPPIS